MKEPMSVPPRTILLACLIGAVMWALFVLLILVLKGTVT